jgi:hypothetical protein
MFITGLGTATPPRRYTQKEGWEAAQGCIKLLDFSLSSIGWRRGLGRGGAFLLVSPLLGPPPLVPRGERMESLMQPCLAPGSHQTRKSVDLRHFFCLVANAFDVHRFVAADGLEVEQQ